MDDLIRTRLGARIRAGRKRTGLTQDDFAAEAGYDRNFWGRLERGLQNPTLTTLVRVAAALGTTVSDLTRDLEVAEVDPAAGHDG